MERPVGDRFVTAPRKDARPLPGKKPDDGNRARRASTTLRSTVAGQGVIPQEYHIQIDVTRNPRKLSSAFDGLDRGLAALHDGGLEAEFRRPELLLDHGQIPSTRAGEAGLDLVVVQRARGGASTTRRPLSRIQFAACIMHLR